ASRVLNEGELVFPNEFAPTSLTSCRICMFTRPFELTCGRMVRMFPVSRYWTELTTLETAIVDVWVEVTIGIDWPTRMCASRLSAAMMCGAESIFTLVIVASALMKRLKFSLLEM